jgi:hypothetical protein
MTTPLEVASMVRCACLVFLLVVACDDKNTTPPDAKPGAKYTVTKETVFHDSGCSDGLGDGKLKKGTKFTLVKAVEGCWNIKLEDEDEVWIVPGRVAQSG